jgi:hypothetical protein
MEAAGIILDGDEVIDEMHFFCHVRSRFGTRLIEDPRRTLGDSQHRFCSRADSQDGMMTRSQRCLCFQPCIELKLQAIIGANPHMWGCWLICGACCIMGACMYTCCCCVCWTYGMPLGVQPMMSLQKVSSDRLLIGGNNHGY